jgi:hypothetical protein
MQYMKNSLIPRLLGAAIAAAALITPAIASAQDVPPYASGGDQQIQGTVSSINGTWNITVSDANGYSDSVQLHQGTIINPTGLTLEPGMSVTIDGYPDGSNFDAMEIDTPYQYQGPPPVAVYYGPGSWYPGYAYGWGPSFSLFFDFSNRRFEQRSFYSEGAVRHAMAPPSGWENRPHGYIGNNGNGGGTQRSYAPPASTPRYLRPTDNGVAPRPTYTAPQTRGYSAPPQQTRTYSAPPQQTRTYSAPPPQQARIYSAPPQQTRTYSAPPQQTRIYSAPPQQTRTYSAPPQQTRTYSAPPQQTRNYSAPPPQARSYSAPPQQARSYSAPAPRAAAPAPRGNQDNGRQRHS